VTEEQIALPIDAVQERLPGLEDSGGKPQRETRRMNDGPSQIPLMVPARDELPEWPLHPHPVSPDQLSFGANQDVLPEAEEQPAQLSLLPDPPPWETPEPEKQAQTTTGRLARRRAKRGISPGQQSLF
jgi:hypothetical protein